MSKSAQNSNLAILPVATPDVPTLASCLQVSKLRLAINRLLINDWPNKDFQKRLYKNAVEGALKDAESESLKVVDSTDGRIVGYLVLTRMNRGGKDVRPQEEVEGKGEGSDKNQVENLTEGLNPIVLKAVAEAVVEIGKAWEGVDHFKITYIYVSPSHRRRGIGTQLVQHCIDRTTREGISLALDAEPEAYDFFTRMGFRDTKAVNFDLAAWAPKWSGFGVFRLTGMTWQKGGVE